MQISVAELRPHNETSIGKWHSRAWFEHMNETEFTVMAEDYRKRGLALALRFLPVSMKTEANAEDVYQDALMHVWRARHNIRTNQTAFFTTTIVNCARTRFRDRAAMDHVAMRFDARSVASSLDDKVYLREVLDVMERLDKRKREAILQVANMVLGPRNSNAVKIRAHRGRLLLHEIMQRDQRRGKLRALLAEGLAA